MDERVSPFCTTCVREPAGRVVGAAAASAGVDAESESADGAPGAAVVGAPADAVEVESCGPGAVPADATWLLGGAAVVGVASAAESALAAADAVASGEIASD